MFLYPESNPSPALFASSLFNLLLSFLVVEESREFSLESFHFQAFFSISAFPLLTLSCIFNSLMQVEDRFRKTNHSSPEAQSKQTGRVLEPPVPSRSESFSNGNSESVHPALQRPAEPQVATASWPRVEETHARAR